MAPNDEFRGPAAVTVAYFLVYKSFFFLQLATRGDAQKRAASRGLTLDKPLADEGAKMGERSFLNALEQMGPFLSSLWLCAVFVSTDIATVMGSIAVFFRMTFPIFWSLGKDGHWSLLVEFSTQPYYISTYSMLGTVALWAFFGVNLGESDTWVQVLAVLGCHVTVFLTANLLSQGLHFVTRRAYVNAGPDAAALRAPGWAPQVVGSGQAEETGNQ